MRFPRPAWESEILTRAAGKKVGMKFCAWTFGKSGPVVMFVHGWSGRGSQFGYYAEALVQKGFRVVLFDGPAHFPEDSAKQTNIDEFSNAIIECQKEFGPLAAIVGHSFGGAATALAIQKGMQTEKAILMATPANLERVFESFIRRLHVGGSAKKNFVDRVVKIAGRNEKEMSIVHMAPQMKTPVLVVHDPKDNEVNFKSAQEIEQLWPGAKVLAPDRVGHYRILKDPGVIGKVVEYISAK